ncbi:MFS transporter [Polaromonas sp. YR568]|uniref:MFS transporter n=1 Tax=Polaromonas sp. YR568 TaxID=1855301 RepID=UPI00398BCB57
MNPAASSALPKPQAKHLLYGLIASLPFSDFLQTGIVAFSAAPIMGDIAASPEEYSMVATLYAVVAIGMIALQRRLVEQLGWRRLVQAAGLLFGLGAVACGLSGSLAGFTAGRLVMAMGCASFMTAARMLVNHIPPSPRRFTGIRFLAGGLAWGLAAGPLLASWALASQNWRAAFFLMAVPAALIAVLAQWAPMDEVVQPRARSRSRSMSLLAVMALMAGSFAALHALQRSGFDFFSEPQRLLAWGALALPVLWLFVRLNRQGGGALIAFGSLAQRRYLVGMGIFATAYLVLGANSIMLPTLLQRVLGLPLEIVGRYLGCGALAGVATLIVVTRLLPRRPGPTPYYLAGFSALLLCAWQLSRLSEGADPFRSVLPALLCNGAFMLAVLPVTAMQTFMKLQHDEETFSHANQLKNMLAQFGIAAGMALATLLMQWRSNVHYTRLAESLSPSNLALGPALEQLTQWFSSTQGASVAPRMALAQLAAWVTQEATLMGALDYFVALSWFAALCLGLVMAEGTWRRFASR